MTSPHSTPITPEKQALVLPETDSNHGSTRVSELCKRPMLNKPEGLQGVLSLLWKEDSTHDESQYEGNAIDCGGQQDLSPCTKPR